MISIEMSNCLDLTIAIPVLNEEVNLKGCLESIGQGFAMHIVVIDSGSEDSTKHIAASFGAEVVEFEWNGEFPKKRNWFLRHHKPKTKWVLFLDADEYLTNKFKLALTRALNNDEYVGYWLNYTIYFLGKPLTGGYPLRKLALFQPGAGEYERIDEVRWSKLDMEIHEHPIIAGNVGQIKSKIDHRDFRGIAHYIAKHNEYSDWESIRYFSSLEIMKNSNSLNWKQKLKYRLIKSPLAGFVYFLGSFLLMGGFLDGSRGLTFAILKMSYFTQIYCKIREINQTNFPFNVQDDNLIL